MKLFPMELLIKAIEKLPELEKQIKERQKHYLFPSGMINSTAIARDLFKVDPLPEGALPYYDKDIDVAAMVIKDEEIMKKEEDFKCEDPCNPFSSNYNGEPVGPDSFGGSDYGSHYMSESVEKIREEFRKRLYKDEAAINSQVSQFRQQQLENQDKAKPLSDWEEFHKEVLKSEVDEEDNKKLELQKYIQSKMEEKERAAEELVSEVLKPLRERFGPPSPVMEIGHELPVDYIPTPTTNAYSDSHGWIQLYSGRKFSPLNPRVEDIDIEDIAHALSNMCRFTGHCKSFYSVAQHCVLVSYLSGTHTLWGLLHDASEAYICDIARPVKRLEAFKPYLEIEKNIQTVICQKFGLQPQEPPIVKQADTNLLHTEARDLMSPLHPDWVSAVKPLPFKIEPLQPTEAKKLFLERYRELMGVEGK